MGGGQYFWLWYVKPTAEGGPPREGQSEIELLLHQAELLHAELELNSRMLEELEARFIETTKKLALEELHTELIETTQRLESELNDRTRWAKRLDAELEQAHAQLQAIYGSLAYRIRSEVTPWLPIRHLLRRHSRNPEKARGSRTKTTSLTPPTRTCSAAGNPGASSGLNSVAL